MRGAKTDDSADGRGQRWDVTWADVERAQLETMPSATPMQRLVWLEEGMRLAHASGALEARRLDLFHVARAPQNPPVTPLHTPPARSKP